MNRSTSLVQSPWLVSMALCALALALRIRIAGDAFWLDEIWSYYLSQLMQSPWDAFSEIRIDNNHLLNTLSLYLLGEQPNWIVYRLPALFSGVATVALIGVAARELDIRPWLAMLLATVSLPLIQYSAEARGYSSAALFALLAWYVWYSRLSRQVTPGWLFVFWLACILGILSHLTFSIVLTALGLAVLWEIVVDRQNWAANLRRACLGFSVPGLFSAWLYFYFYSRMSAGGSSPDWQLLPSLLELGRVTVGAPDAVAITWLSGLLLVVMLPLGLMSLPVAHRRFFAFVLLLVPGLLLTIYQPDYFYPRYLLVCLPFAYLLLARALGTALDAGTLGRGIGIALLLALVTGSLVNYAELARWGKGDYPQAVADLYAASDAPSFTVGSDFDFRNKALLDFYKRYRKDAGRMTYIDKSYESSTATDFFIVHKLEHDATPAPVITLKSGRYRLLKQYPYAGLSGWNWYLYRHE